jgi:hypothetical protein
MSIMKKKRKDSEEPFVTSRIGWKYHHLGIPTTTPRPGEHYLKHLKIHVAGFSTSPYGIEWMRFDPDCQISELVRTVPHIAFSVENLELALKGRKLLGEISSPSKGVRVAMIIDDGAPIELIEFSSCEDTKRKKSNRMR